MLGQIIAKPVNLLFLDEPTNHLDMHSIDALTKAIKNFEGSAIIVTHSEKLLRDVCDRLIVFNSEGARYFDGNYDDFLDKIGWEDEVLDNKPVKKENSNIKKLNKKERALLIQERNKLTSPLKKIVNKLEDEIMELEDIISNEQEELIEASNNLDNSKVIELSSKIREKENIVEEKFELLEENQLKLDEILEEYAEKII